MADTRWQLGYRAMRRATLAYARLDLILQRISVASRLFADGVLSHATTVEEKIDLGPWLYDISHQPYLPKAGLWDWEVSWFERRLPTRGARILVAACGSGREVVPLIARGHIVDAFDPARHMAERCEQSCRHDVRHRVRVGSYDDLCRSVLDGAQTPLSEFAAARYDAVLLGWSSLIHVLTRERQLRLMRAANILAPAGPILASFLLQLAPRELSGSRSHRLGRAVGIAIARGRRLTPGDHRGAEGIEFSRTVGFTRLYRKTDIDSLAQAIGREAMWEPEPGFCHVTFAIPDV